MRMTATPLVLGVVLLAACGGSNLEADDPAGYEACVLLADSAGIEDDPLMKMGALFEVAEQAGKATTEEIRDTASPVFDKESREIVEDAGGEAPNTGLVDSDALAEACESNGVDIP